MNKQEIIQGLKNGQTLYLMNVRTNFKERKIVEELKNEGLVTVKFKDFPDNQYSCYEIKWKFKI